MGQKASNNGKALNSASAKQTFKEMKTEIELLRKQLLGIYKQKTGSFSSVGEDLCTFIDILHLLKQQKLESEYQLYLSKIAQYISLTINARDQLYYILQQNVITNEKNIFKIEVFLLKLQDSSSMKYSAEYLFQLGKEFEDLDEEQLSTSCSI